MPGEPRLPAGLLDELRHVLRLNRGAVQLDPGLGKERLGLGADEIGLGLGIISIVALGLAYPSGMLADRFGRKAVIVPSSLMTALAFMLFLATGVERRVRVG